MTEKHTLEARGAGVYRDGKLFAALGDDGDAELQREYAVKFAAVDDLVDACDFALTILEGMGNGKGGAANACRAAIAKAEGR